MKWDYDSGSESFDERDPGLFIICEGNFQYGNATLSYYNTADSRVENEVFFKANGMKLGDVAQSMTMYGGKGWIVVNNSHVIFAIDPVTMKEVGRITNLTSPRYIHFINEEKAYVSQLWDNRIYIINPSTYSVSGFIEVPGMSKESGSTEQMVQLGKFVYCNCWSYQNSVIKIDTESDTVVDSIEVGIQPVSLVKDCNGYLWTLTDGGLEGSPYGYEAPRLVCIDPETFIIKRIFRFRLGDSPSELVTNGDGNTLYWINRDVWKMDVSALSLPSSPFVEQMNTKFFGLTVDPVTSEVFVADAIDYTQRGVIYRFSPSGEPLDRFYVGVSPGAFCWKK